MALTKIRTSPIRISALKFWGMRPRCVGAVEKYNTVAVLCLKRGGGLHTVSVEIDGVLILSFSFPSFSKSPNAKNASQGGWWRPTGTFIFTIFPYEMFQMNNWFSVALIRKAVLINLTPSSFPSGCWTINLTGGEIWWYAIWFRTPYSRWK